MRCRNVSIGLRKRATRAIYTSHTSGLLEGYMSGPLERPRADYSSGLLERATRPSRLRHMQAMFTLCAASPI